MYNATIRYEVKGEQAIEKVRGKLNDIMNKANQIHNSGKRVLMVTAIKK